MHLSKFLLFAIVAICTILLSCNKKNAEATSEATEEEITSNPEKEPSPASKEKVQVVGFQKTPCYGKCPIYEVKFYDTGDVLWEGKANVKRKGEYTAQVDRETLIAIRDKADSLGYWNFYEKYPMENRVADLPTTITMVRAGDMIKTVRNTHDAPEDLLAFENYLLDLINGLDWKMKEINK